VKGETEPQARLKGHASLGFGKFLEEKQQIGNITSQERAVVAGEITWPKKQRKRKLVFAEVESPESLGLLWKGSGERGGGGAVLVWEGNCDLSRIKGEWWEWMAGENPCTVQIVKKDQNVKKKSSTIQNRTGRTKCGLRGKANRVQKQQSRTQRRRLRGGEGAT